MTKEEVPHYRAGDPSSPAAAASRKSWIAPKAGEPPWHLVDLWWTLPADVPALEEWSMSVEVRGHVADDVKLYMAPLGVCFLGPKKISTYGGIQTQSDGYRYPDLREQNGEFHCYGKGCIFSRWDSRDPNDVRVEDDGYWCSGGESWSGEGNFLSVRVPFPWAEGRKYTFSMKSKKAAEEEGGGTWLTASVGQPGAERRVGSLRFDASPLRFSRSFASFVEIYGGPTDPAKTPAVDVIFSDVRVNGKLVTEAEFSSIKAVYPRDVPQQLHAQCEAGTAQQSSPSVLCRVSPYEVERPRGQQVALL